MSPEEFKAIQATLPNEPGVYRYYGEDEDLLYVGKAKDLRKRVSSYFNAGRGDSNRIRLLVRKIRRIEFTIVATEQEALLLENSLIKESQPRYNIQLKDDKSYPFIVIRKERFPRIFITRRLIRDGSEYLGPYTSVVRTRAILEFIRSLYPIRTCKLNLAEKPIAEGKYKVCLEYHLGNCLGPCEGLQSEDDYQDSIIQIRHILRGNFGPVKRTLKARMQQAAGQLEFEKAEHYRRRLANVEDFQSRSTVVSSRIDKVDVYAIAEADTFACICHLHVLRGNVVQTEVVEVSRKLDETPGELLAYAVSVLRGRAEDPAEELILPLPIELADTGLLQVVPQRGDKAKLLELARQNAVYHRTERMTKKAAKEERPATKAVLEALRDDFRLSELPRHIECFDNSNIQGTSPVASMVLFRDAKPSNKEYRHYHIRSVEGPDDFASMKEVVFRRYRKLRDEDLPLPQLVVIDGGKGQLNAAWESLKELGLERKVALVSIAKRLEEIYFPDDPMPLHINKRSPSLKVVQQLRNEAHRFAIGFHRDTRSRGAINSELEGIDGIGEKSIQELLRRFKSARKVREATYREIAEVIGNRRARLLRDYFDGKEGEKSAPKTD